MARVGAVGISIAVVVGCAFAGGTSPVSAQTMDRAVYTFLQLDQAEYVGSSSAAPFAYDARGWVGGDYNRIWFRAEGEHGEGSAGDIEGQVLYSRLVAPFWDAQAGLRVDAQYGDSADARVLLVAGLQGLAPYGFEMETFLFLSQHGDVSARLQVSYDILLTQRLIVEPEVELNVAVQEVPAFGVGSGVNDVSVGTRLRYELRREVAPYVGWIWERRLGDTADFALAAGDVTSYGSLVAGVRLWY